MAGLWIVFIALSIVAVAVGVWVDSEDRKAGRR